MSAPRVGDPLPRLAARLIDASISPGWRRDALLGDLAEAHVARRRLRGPLVATATTLFIAARIAASFGTTRLRSRDPLHPNPRGDRPMRSLPNDLRFAARALRRAPAFSLAVVLTLAIGIAAAVSVFAALEAAVLRPLPYPQPEQLVLGRTSHPQGLNWTSSAQDWADLRDQVDGFRDLGAMTGFMSGATVIGTDEPLRVHRALASANLFRTLGVEPAAGRHFAEDETVVGGPDVVILSHAFWQRSLASDPAIIGETIDLNGVPTTVVGIMPAGFRLLYDVDLWQPLRLDGDYARARRFHNWVMIGRLLPSTTLQQTQQQVDAVAVQLAAAYPDSNTDKGFRFDPLASVLTEGSRTQLTALVVAVLLLVLISTGNVAGLLLVRGASRRHELAVRAALGALRSHLVRQLMIEGLLLSLAAGALGLLAAQLMASALLSLLPLDALGIERLTLNGSVVAFALLLSVATSIAFTLMPALRASRVHPGRELTATRGADTGVTVRLRSGLVVAQIALTVVLLAGSGLLLRSLGQLGSVDLGFDSANLLTAEIQLPRAEYPQARAGQFYETLIERASALPGVSGAGIISQLPVRDPGNNIAVQRADLARGNQGIDGPLAYARSVLPGYFLTLRIPVLAGRDVSSEDTAESPPVVVVNRRLADALFEGEDPLGREIFIDAGDGAAFTIIGVVGDVRLNGPGSESQPVFYVPAPQWMPATARLALRLQGDPAGVAAGLRGVLRDLDPAIPLDGVDTMDAILADRLGQRRVLAMALLLFAASALTLAGVGLYGVLAEGVLQRRREIGVRMALGAARQRVVGLVVRQGTVLVGIGLAVGLVGALALTRLIAGLLYQVSPYDPLTLATVTLTLGAIGLIAVAVPASRAARVDPAIALRGD